MGDMIEGSAVKCSPGVSEQSGGKTCCFQVPEHVYIECVVFLSEVSDCL